MRCPAGGDASRPRPPGSGTDRLPDGLYAPDLARISDDKVLIPGTGGRAGGDRDARAAGCETPSATAGSAQRRQLLHDYVSSIYDSRSTEFAEQIRVTP